MGSGGGGSSNTTTQVQQLPEFEQQYAQQNQDIAASIASQPFPNYQGQMIAGFSPQQTQGMQQAQDSSTAYQPYFQQAQTDLQQAAQPWNAQTAQQYMSPYAQAALQPQVQALQLQMAQQQHASDASSTQAGAFGDARNGVQNSLNNFYGNQSLNGLEAQGMNTAYNTGLSAYQNQQQVLGNAGAAEMNLGNAATNTGLAGAQGNFNMGTQQQQLSQEQLSNSYQQFINQTLWPQQGLNIRMSALSNSPYDTAQYLTQPPTNASASNLGAFAGIAGGLQNLLGGSGGSSSAQAPIGGTALTSDIRLKKNLKFVGRTKKGIPVYEYNYIWDDETNWIGVMAQDVREIIPEAVHELSDGTLIVNYERVG